MGGWMSPGGWMDGWSEFHWEPGTSHQMTILQNTGSSNSIGVYLEPYAEDGRLRGRTSVTCTRGAIPQRHTAGNRAA